MLTLTNRFFAIGLCAVFLSACGQRTPKRGAVRRDDKKHANGQFASKIEYYLDDTGKAVKHGREARYDENGNFYIRGVNKDGKPHGPWQEFYPDGSYKGVVGFTDGQPDGKLTMWHPNGHLKTTGQNDKGLQIGTWMHYNEQGQVVKKQVYKKGELKTEETFQPVPLDPKDVPKPTVLPKDGICANKAIPDPKPATDKAPEKETETPEETPEDAKVEVPSAPAPKAPAPKAE